jgi:hypothetical protein
VKRLRLIIGTDAPNALYYQLLELGGAPKILCEAKRKLTLYANIAELSQKWTTVVCSLELRLLEDYARETISAVERAQQLGRKSISEIRESIISDDQWRSETERICSAFAVETGKFLDQFSLEVYQECLPKPEDSFWSFFDELVDTPSKAAANSISEPGTIPQVPLLQLQGECPVDRRK